MSIKLVITGMFVVGLLGCSTMAGPGALNIPAAISAATTPSDHQKIAEYYTRKAAEYQSEADQHEMLARSYTSRPKGEFGSMISHCRNLRDQFISAANTARAMAQEHRQMATGGKT